MDQVIEGLYATAPTPLPFASTVLMRAFLLRREGGENLLIYNAPVLDGERAAIAELGGVSRQYLGHWHEARFGENAQLDVPLLVHAGDRDEVASTHSVAETFTERGSVGDDFQIIPIPGHTPGATAFLWDSGEHRVLFTGDSLMVGERGEWTVAVLDSSDRDAYIESLELMRELDFDVLVPWVAGAGDPPHAFTDAADARRRLDAIVDRVRGGADR